MGEDEEKEKDEEEEEDEEDTGEGDVLPVRGYARYMLAVWAGGWAQAASCLVFQFFMCSNVFSWIFPLLITHRVFGPLCPISNFLRCPPDRPLSSASGRGARSA